MKIRIFSSVVFLFVLTGCSVDLTPQWVFDFFTTRVVNYLLLFAGLVVLSILTDAVQKNTAIGLIWLVGVFGVFLTGIFYWRMGGQMAGQPEKEIFSTAFNIGFAHAIVSLSVLIFLGNMFTLGIWIISRVIGIPILLLTRFINWITKSDSPRLWNLTTGCLGNISILVLFLGIPYGYYLLMIGSIDLQMFLFGNYDRYLGLFFPTQFKLLVLIEQLQFQWNKILSDPILGAYIIAFGVLFAAANKIVGLIDVAQKIRGFFRKRTSVN